MTERRSLLALAAGAGVAGCSPFRLLNALPSDAARVAARDVAYGRDPRQTLDVYVPHRVESEPAPVLVFFYGGSWASGAKADYAFAGRSLAAEGFVTVVPDYRLVPDVRFPAFVEDGAAAVVHAMAHAGGWGGDASRLVLAGHSAGAYIAAMLALDPGYLARAGAPPGVVRAWAGLSGPYDFLPFDVKASQDAFGAWPDPAATQPITFAGAQDPPTFLAHGSKDTTVKVRNTERLAAKLRAAGVPVEAHVYEGLDHKDVVLALTRTFRGKAGVRADMARFLHSRTPDLAGPPGRPQGA